MLEFQEKRKIRTFAYSKVVVFILLIIIIYLFNAVWNVYCKQDLAKENLAKTEATFKELKEREEMLTERIASLRTDIGVEEEIRDKYGLVKPGEEVIIVVDNSTSSDITSEEDDRPGFWQKILNWFN